MKILIDTSVCSIGGGVQVALSCINNIINDSAFDVILVASPQVDLQLSDVSKSKIKFYYKEVNEPIYKKHSQGKRLSEIELRHQPDLVFIVFGPSYWRPKAITLQGFALPLMVYPNIRNFIYKKNPILFLYQKLMNTYKAYLMKKNSDFILVETSTFKARVHDFLKFDLNKIFVIENSFNSNFYSIDNYKKTSNLLEIFIPTSYYPHKNLEILPQVAKFLTAMNFINFKFNFLIPEQSESWKKIFNEAKKLDVSRYFQTFGFVNNDEMKHLYARSDLVLLPTLAEASTAVYPETFFSKKVLLTSKVDFALELCGEAAVFFDPHDPYDIATKIVDTVGNKELQNCLIDKGISQLEISYLSPELKWKKQKDLFFNILQESK